MTPPSGLRIEDTPVCVDGRAISEPRVANTGCPNSPALRAYCRGLITDVLERHDGVCGVFLDWAEFPAYGLAELFTCFCPQCEEAARSLGIDWKRVHAHVGEIWSRLHELDARDCRRVRRLIERPSAILELLMRYPGCLDFARFKAMSVARLYEAVGSVLREIGREDAVIGARGWAPPWNRTSGMDYRTLAATCAVVAPKLFTFDYAAVPRWYGQTLKDWNPHVPEEELVETLLDVLDLSRLPGYERLDAYRIPNPHEQHPLDGDAYERRITEVVDQVGGRARVIPITHAYGPLDQWKRAVAIARDAGAGMWVQMYGYLSQEKLEVLHAAWR